MYRVVSVVSKIINPVECTIMGVARIVLSWGTIGVGFKGPGQSPGGGARYKWVIHQFLNKKD